jgi:diguanylate cyclase (GGDEF)-like protein/PAS domain S-box-containing protein
MAHRPALRPARGTRSGNVPALHASPTMSDAAPAGLDDAFMFRALMDTITDSIYFKDRRCRLLRVNRQMATNLGVSSPDDVVGKTDIDLFGGPFGHRTFLEDLRIMEADTPMTGFVESRLLDDGALNWTLTTKIPLHDADGEVIGLVGITREINELKQTELDLQHLATHDVLTGLPNRFLMMDRLNQTIARAGRERSALAVVFLDIDGFKTINDRFGHEVGDQALRLLGQRLTASVRANDTIARTGGDEFVMILEPAGARDAVMVAEKVRQALLEPLMQRIPEVSPTVSMGIAIFPDHGEDAEGLLRSADFAMYRAKRLGKDSYLVCPTNAPAATRPLARGRKPPRGR